MITGDVNAKATTLLGFWNVKTMYERGRMAQVIVEMKRNELDISATMPQCWAAQFSRCDHRKHLANTFRHHMEQKENPWWLESGRHHQDTEERSSVRM